MIFVDKDENILRIALFKLSSCHLDHRQWPSPIHIQRNLVDKMQVNKKENRKEWIIFLVKIVVLQYQLKPGALAQCIW